MLFSFDCRRIRTRLDPNEGRVPIGKKIEHRVKIKDRHAAISAQDLGMIKIKTKTKRNVNLPDMTTVVHPEAKKMVNYPMMENRMIPLSKFTIQRTIVNRNRPIIVMTNILLIENIKVVPDSLVLVQIQNAFYKRCDSMIWKRIQFKRRFLFLHSFQI